MYRNLKIKVKTAGDLGLNNLLKVLFYKFLLKYEIHTVNKIVGRAPRKPFFSENIKGDLSFVGYQGCSQLFGWWKLPLGVKPPNWFSGPFNISFQEQEKCNWWLIDDFSNGEIKVIWEKSRFEWLILMALNTRSGRQEEILKINNWLDDWSEKNSPYLGPNWKCGQEASIRVLHLIISCWILGQNNSPNLNLIKLIQIHLKRIEPTISYAIGQQNNHAVTEAAALFVGGSFLLEYEKKAKRWMDKGRLLLERSAQNLLDDDGTFSQYSVNYHRLMLDSFSISKAWQMKNKLPEFSLKFQNRLQNATYWLFNLTSAKNGCTPNIGANDSARIIPLTKCDLKDFRPSIQLAAALFMNSDAYGAGPWNLPLKILGVPNGQLALKEKSISFNQGGFHILKKPKSMAVLRYPRFKFRPSQADALHLDFWHRGENILRDAGSYSYNSKDTSWFAGTSAHNTICFDNRDQMPRLGRFLFGAWLKTSQVEHVCHDRNKVSAAASYIDIYGAKHYRRIILENGSMRCIDTVSGSFKKACIYWRLKPGKWIVSENYLTCDSYQLNIKLDGKSVKPLVGKTYESLYYLQKKTIPFAYFNFTKPCTITTELKF